MSTSKQASPVQSKFKTRDLVFAAAGIAIVTICSWIAIPTTIPFTLQTFAVCLISALLGWKLGLWVVLGYILLGALGVPVFSNFTGGIAILTGPTGGYIIGFIFTALLVGLAVDHFGRSWPVLLLSMGLGILICYVFGTAWFILVYTQKTGSIGLMTALSWCVFPYIPADAAKVVLAALLTHRLYPLLIKRKQ